jgi:hypothetical protein
MVGHVGRVDDENKNDNNKMMLPDPWYLYYAEP